MIITSPVWQGKGLDISSSESENRPMNDITSLKVNKNGASDVSLESTKWQVRNSIVEDQRIK